VQAERARNLQMMRARRGRMSTVLAGGELGTGGGMSGQTPRTTLGGDR
jgi:hypothetical protein